VADDIFVRALLCALTCIVDLSVWRWIKDQASPFLDS